LQLGEALQALGAEGDEAMATEIAAILRHAEPQVALAIDDSDSLSTGERRQAGENGARPVARTAGRRERQLSPWSDRSM